MPGAGVTSAAPLPPISGASAVDGSREHTGRASPGNAGIADALDEVGELLAAQEAKPFRAQAYHRAADMIRALPQSLAAIARTGGAEAVAELPTIGRSLARVVAEMVETGRLGILDSLRGHADPEALLASVPGVGSELAQRIHERLGLHTLEDLELAAHDGRLGRVPGFGARRVRAVMETLAGRLGRRAPRVPVCAAGGEPPVGELLDVDREYREKAEAGVLRRIAPRRFNPHGRAWLPILHTERDHRHYTALFSNTTRAHQLGKTGDWVVIFLDDGDTHRQATVVTETHGLFDGERVVRGRERECAAFYRRAVRTTPRTLPAPSLFGHSEPPYADWAP